MSNQDPRVEAPDVDDLHARISAHSEQIADTAVALQAIKIECDTLRGAAQTLVDTLNHTQVSFDDPAAMTALRALEALL